MYQLKKNKKGASAIEMVIGFLFIVMMISFLVDVTIVISKYSTVAQLNTDIARITGVQGGVLNSKPAGWYGEDESYITVSKMQSMLNEKFKSAGIKNNEWSLRIVKDGAEIGRLGKSGTSQAKINYLDNYTVELSVDYSWDTIGQFLPGNINQTLVSKRPATSEWKYDYNNWSDGLD